MRDEEALLRAIADEPHDDLPRLAYADWLEENGDLDRAEFIRVQCRLAEMSPLDPERLMLELSERKLLMTNDAEWIKRTLGGVKIGCLGFACGFPHISLAGNNLAAIESIPAGMPIGRISVNSPPPNADTQLWGSERAQEAFSRSTRLAATPQLTIHGISNPKFMGFLARTPRLPRIRSLELLAGNGRDQGLVELARSPHLSRLCRFALHDKQAGDDGLSALAEAPWLSGLKHLHLEMPQATHVGIDAIIRSKMLGGLESLDLSWGRRERSPGGYQLFEIVESSTLGKLRTLRYRGALEATELRELSHFQGLERLTGLGLSRACADEDIIALAQSPHLRNITYFDLTANYFSERGLSVLAQSSSMAQLRVLVLTGVYLRDAGAHAIADSPVLTNLVALYLGGTAIGDQGVRALARSPNLACLRYLDLSRCSVTNDGARAIAESPFFGELRMLYLGDNRQVTEVGFAAVRNSPNLPHLLVDPRSDSRRAIDLEEEEDMDWE